MGDLPSNSKVLEEGPFGIFVASKADAGERAVFKDNVLENNGTLNGGPYGIELPPERFGASGAVETIVREDEPPLQ